MLLLGGYRAETIEEQWEGKGRETWKRFGRYSRFGTAGVRVAEKAERRSCGLIPGFRLG